MSEIYYLEYNDKWKSFLGETLENPTKKWWALEPGLRYCNILERKHIPYRIDFKSSYMGEFDYIVNGNGYEGSRISIRLSVPVYEGGHWNYTKEKFEEQVGGALFIPHTFMGEALSHELFGIFKLLHPELKHGFYNQEIKKWELVERSENKELREKFPDTYMEDQLGFAYFKWHGDVYRCRADNWGPIDVTNGMPANVRWECPLGLFRPDVVPV